MSDETRAELRRKALRQVMAERGLSPADVARMIGLPTANAIYNFLNKRSKALSSDTYEKMAKFIPDTSMAQLTGLASRAPDQKGAILRTVAQAGLWRDRFDLPHVEQCEVPLPITQAQALAGGYAAKVLPPGAEMRWPHGALLLVAGSWVVVECVHEGRVEVTVRQIEVDNGKGWLWLRTSNARFIGAVPVSWPCDGRPWRHDGDRYQVMGLVMGAWEPLGQI